MGARNALGLCRGAFFRNRKKLWPGQTVWFYPGGLPFGCRRSHHPRGLRDGLDRLSVLAASFCLIRTGALLPWVLGGQRMLAFVHHWPSLSGTWEGSMMSREWLDAHAQSKARHPSIGVCATWLTRRV